MAKSIGPYFEFVVNKEGPRTEFQFLPGNISKDIFLVAKKLIIRTFENEYGINAVDHVRETNLEDGSKTISIYQTKVIAALRIILGTPAFKYFKIKFSGISNKGEPGSIMINNYVEIEQAKKYIPYANKFNNDLTTGRNK